MNERELIAERTIYAIDKDLRGFEIQLLVGKPYQVSPTEWACPAAVLGLYDFLSDLHGVDSWQSLVLAQNMIHRILYYFVEDGGRLFWEQNGEKLTIDELFGEGPDETPEPDGPLTEEQQDRVNRLTANELQIIDDALMAGASTQFRKVARVVGIAMAVDSDKFKLVPDIFYASRVRKLVEEGRLLSQGNLEFMRFSEVRLPE